VSVRESGQVDAASDVFPVRFEAEEWLSGLAVRWCSTILLLERVRVNGVLVPGGIMVNHAGDSDSDRGNHEDHQDSGFRGKGADLRGSTEGRKGAGGGIGDGNGTDDGRYGSGQWGLPRDPLIPNETFPPLVGIRITLHHAGVILSAGIGEALLRLARRWANLPLEVIRRVRRHGVTSRQPDPVCGEGGGGGGGGERRDLNV